MAKRKNKKKATDKFQMVTDQLIQQLENGVKPWVKPWFSRSFQNLASGHEYRGGNPMFLAVQMMAQGFDTPLFIGYKQAQSKGWQIRKGSKACYVRYASSFRYEKENDEGEKEEKKGFTVRWIPVFNVAAIDDSEAEKKVEDFIEAWEGQNEDKPNKSLEQFLADSGAEINHGGDRAFYSPSKDAIQLPAFADFTSADTYYSTAIHELVHWTGHNSRCDRDMSGSFGSSSYAREELVAETGAAFLCAMFDIESTLENHASYIDNWLDALRGDKKFFFDAVSKAEKAAEYLIELTGLQTEAEAKELEPALAIA
jgi:antirestriction protein ArdC